jgi:hypothetical protein
MVRWNFKRKGIFCALCTRGLGGCVEIEGWADQRELDRVGGGHDISTLGGELTVAGRVLVATAQPLFVSCKHARRVTFGMRQKEV